MLTELVRVGCSFLTCRGGLGKYQTCLIFHRPSTTLYLGLWLEEARAEEVKLQKEGFAEKKA